MIDRSDYTRSVTLANGQSALLGSVLVEARQDGSGCSTPRVFPVLVLVMIGPVNFAIGLGR